MHPINILERYWNFTSFRPLQEEIIEAVLQGEDVFALLPTGGGKSLCFQIPALAKDGICIVVSPLIALMKDQVNALQQKGIKALCITSGISYGELDTLLDNCIYGNYKFLYLSPERLQQELVQDRIKQMPVNLIAVDEAHCISQWGNDFRPAYKNIELLRQIKPSVNCIALTASATPTVVEDIVEELDFIQPKIFKQSFKRSNLAYMTFDEDDKHYRLETILKKNPQSAIVYVRSRRLTIEISNFLNKKGISATAYHGGLSNKVKDTHQHEWINNQKQVMVATNAFGMGIDKPDVKTVIHINLPESIESYFQEAGRAGRNGEKAFAVILKNKSDLLLVKNQFLKTLPSIKDVKHIYRKLSNYFQISYGEGQNTLYNFNFNDFCKTYQLPGLITYNALQLLDRTSLITLSKQFNKKTSLQFIITNKSLFSYLETHPELSVIVKTILRTYGGIFEHDTKINSLLVSEKAAVSEDYLFKSLKQLEKDEIITLSLSTTDSEVTYLQPREDDMAINRISHYIENQNKLKYNQVHSVIDYVENNETCKSVQLLSYFGEKNVEDCGICSVCIKKNKKQNRADPKQIQTEVLQALTVKDLSSRELMEQISCSETDLKKVLKLLLEHQLISITNKNTYKLH
ncbi:RecQ family ATP-dependent DNA helicase [Xanthomarina sp. F1114]|uniref:RecQ family ATP-dependent DNA helicase n=1 Tax=Xanthomarina sp. F1114 TaxID=2996019 RepID=UPI00225E0D61|nr:ATP-dependent DNA helicase RecQ [Xanthomarina sp. F1114]MCX7548564.1 RecQ family ATP-dependent DNA helicase [Xanthomarina sp. F1114]